MENNNYVVDRSSIYFGILVENKDEIHNLGDVGNSYYPSIYKVYRPILFRLDENNCANDLLNNTPNYPVLGHLPIHVFQKNKVMVIDSFCLGDLLEYRGYSELLDLSDVISIRNKIFTYRFLFENSSLFGYERISPCDITVYDYPYNYNNKLNAEVVELTLEQKIKGRKYIVINGYYFVRTKKEGVFPSELFEVISQYVNNRLLIRFGGNFNPLPAEKKAGYARRLRRI